MYEEREIDYSGCNKKQLIAMFKEAGKGMLTLLRKRIMTSAKEGYDSKEGDGNAARDGQIKTDSVAMSTLKMQLELEKLKAKRVDMEIIMQRERVTLSVDQSSDQTARSDDNGVRSDIRKGDVIS